MNGDNNDCIYDGDRRPASENAAEKAKAAEVCSASGNLLANSGAVVLTKDFKVKGTERALKRGTVTRSISEIH